MLHTYKAHLREELEIEASIPTFIPEAIIHFGHSLVQDRIPLAACNQDIRDGDRAGEVSHDLCAGVY